MLCTGLLRLAIDPRGGSGGGGGGQGSTYIQSIKEIARNLISQMRQPTHPPTHPPTVGWHIILSQSTDVLAKVLMGSDLLAFPSIWLLLGYCIKFLHPRG